MLGTVHQHILILKLVNAYLNQVDIVSASSLNMLILGYCAPPIIIESNVTVMANSRGFIEGTSITYYCQQPGNESTVEPIVAVCTRDGYWSPNPDELECPVNLHSYVTENSWTDGSDISSGSSEGNYKELYYNSNMFNLIFPLIMQ